MPAPVALLVACISLIVVGVCVAGKGNVPNDCVVPAVYGINVVDDTDELGIFVDCSKIDFAFVCTVDDDRLTVLVTMVVCRPK